MSEIYLGALSGTSMDAIDVVLAAFEQNKVHPIAFHKSPIDAALAQQAREIQQTKHSLKDLAYLDCQFAYAFAEAIKDALAKSAAREVRALGLHGQTILHNPNADCPSTIQIGDPNIVATQTQLTTVADFRRADMAYGGQGAPLTPAFHAFALCRHPCEKAVVNIGGIANITFLSEHGAVRAGFDAGPGNCLMDAWVSRHKQLPFDDGGKWAANGEPDLALLDALLSDPYFKAPAPKSACVSQFDMAWLESHLPADYDPLQVQSTLAELTVRCIADAIQNHTSNILQVLVCGGGVHNEHVLKRLGEQTGLSITTTAAEGIDPLQVEALAFAWLAHCRIHNIKASIPAVTGASQAALLGAIYQPN